MSKKPVSPLRQRLIDDITARRFSEDTKRDYVRNVRKFAAFLGRSPVMPVGYATFKEPASCRRRDNAAPPELIKRYGADNGFGWALGDVVGAQIVSIPAQVAEDRAVAVEKTVMLWLSGIFAGLCALVNGLVYSFHKRKGFAKPVRAQPLSL